MGSISATKRRRWKNPVGCDLSLMMEIAAVCPQRANAERLAIILNQCLNLLDSRGVEILDFSYSRWREKVFPWLTEKQIEHGLAALVEMGYITKEPHRNGAHYRATDKCFTDDDSLPATGSLLPSTGSQPPEDAESLSKDSTEVLTDKIAVPNGTARARSSGGALPGLETSPQPPPIDQVYHDAVRAYKVASQKLTDKGFPLRNDRKDPAVLSGCRNGLDIDQARNAPKVFAWALTRTAWPQQIQNRVIWTKPDAWQRLWADWMANTQNATTRGSPSVRQEQMQRLRRGEGDHPDQPAGVHIPPPLSDD